MQWIANPQNREFESHPVLQRMRVDSGKGRPAVFQTENAEFDSPYPLQVMPL
jgi:hypothetical protein